MTRQTRPKRPPKYDRLVNPDARREETLAHYALGPFDAACRDMDRKWGTDRLPTLVTPELAALWGQTMANLNAAIEATYNAGDPDQARADLIACVESALRGFKAMDDFAESTKQLKADPKIWEYDLDGFRFAIIDDDRMWHGIKVERPDLLLFTMREAAVALQLHNAGVGVLSELKEHSQNAAIVETRPKLPRDFYDNGGDDLNEILQ